MRRALPLGAFRKDVRRLSKRGWDIKKLDEIISALQNNSSLPPSARPHLLQGKWAGCWDCHIAGDWILIYEIAENEVRLHRTGTHADLFE